MAFKTLSKKALAKRLANYGSNLLLIVVVAVAIAPALFTKGESGFSGEQNVIYCQQGVVCQVHFLMLAGAFGHMTLLGDVVIDVRQIDGDVLTSPRGKTRSLASVVQHETAHQLQLAELGYLRFHLTKTWITEGLAEQGLDSYSNSEKVDLCQYPAKASNALKYAYYRALVSHFLTDRSEDQIIADNISFKQALSVACDAVSNNFRPPSQEATNT